MASSKLPMIAKPKAVARAGNQSAHCQAVVAAWARESLNRGLSARAARLPAQNREVNSATRYTTAPTGPKPTTDNTAYQKNTPNTWRCASITECSMTCRTISLRGRALASTCCHFANNSRAKDSLPSSSASRMSVKWWLNCRKPSVAYNSATFQATAKTQPSVSASSQCTAKASKAGAPTAIDQANQLCCFCPASTWRATQEAHWRKLWCKKCWPDRGRTCSITKAKKMEKKLMGTS